jgi:hypothetical protein
MKKREYSKIILKENLKIDDKKKETKQRKKEREKKPDLKKKRFFQTSNLHLIKQKYKVFLIIFIIKHIRKTRNVLKKKIETNK